MKENSFVIFGSSPFVNELDVKKICSEHKTIGINMAAIFNPEIEYIAFQDTGFFTGLKDSIKQKMVITHLIQSELKETYNGNNCIIGKDFVKEPFYISKNDYDNTSLLAIEFAISQGAKEIILAGIDLEASWNYFYGDGRGQTLEYISNIKKQIEDFSKQVKIYKANPKANIDLEVREL